MLRINFLGESRIERDGAVLGLPPSRKTRALLAYLVVTGRSHRRERLCSLLWDLPDDPRGALRWSLSKIRALVDEPGTPRIVANRDMVAFDAQGARIDLLEVRQVARDPGGSTTAALDAAARLFRGDFLEGADQPDCFEFQAWCLAERESARAHHARILSALVHRLTGRPEAMLPHARLLVQIEPHDEAAWAMLVRVLAAVGRRREAEEQCDLGRRTLADAGIDASGPLLKVSRNLRKTAASAEQHAAPLQVGGRLAGLSRRTKVRVLPIDAASNDPADVILADAITDDLVFGLSRHRHLAVVLGRPMAAGDAPPSEASDRRWYDRAEYIVDGTLRRRDARLAVTVRVVDAADSRQIWSERCSLRLDAALRMDDLVARRITAALHDEIAQADAAKAQGLTLDELDATALYSVGLDHMYRFTQPALVAAQAHFERAIELDPHFASAQARLAYVHIQHYWYGPIGRRDGSLDQARAAAMHAIALDSRNALGHLALGRVDALRGHFDAAIPELEVAVRLNPALAQAFFGLGQALWYADRARDAVRLLDTAIELNPHDPHLWTFYHDQSEAYFSLGELDAAARGAQAAARLSNATHWPWLTLSAVFGSAGKHEEAAAARRQLSTRWLIRDLAQARDQLQHFANEMFVARYLDGLRAAGLPE